MIPAVRIVKYGPLKKAHQGYLWIERLFQTPLEDGRHRILWLIIGPYLVNIKGVNEESAVQQACDYLQTCNKKKKLTGDHRNLARYYVRYAIEKGLKPLSLNSVEEKYPELYSMLKEERAI